jgi:N-dimethylarginine dimethylaminohydrolase
MPTGEHAATTLFSRPTFLMCSPRFFDVSYVINPWMEGNLHAPSYALAVEQWKRLREAVASVADVLEIEPQPALPDMVFTANAGLVGPGPLGSQFVLSRFRHPERQREEKFFREWFEVEGFTISTPAPDTPFEGEGDALFTPDGSHLWAGFGWRTELASHSLLRETFCASESATPGAAPAASPTRDLTALRLVDPRFYHLDTCFAPLPGGELLYFPPAFDQPSLAAIESFYPADTRIPVSEADALHFACNAVTTGQTIILNQATAALQADLTARGYTVLQTPLTEFLKAGGAAKCLCLHLA